MAGIPQKTADLSAVPLFPLPNVVLFPRAVLPLHIFEERYKAMVADALAGTRQIAMSLLKSGWEKSYHHKPPIEPVVCVGAILTHERCPDGTYNLLLQGKARARIVGEHGALAYRMAELAPLKDSAVFEIELTDERQRLTSLFEDESPRTSGIGKQFLQLLAGPLPTSEIADLIAFNFLEDINLKQSLLADTDVRGRVARTIDAFEEVLPALAPISSRSAPGPSMN